MSDRGHQGRAARPGCAHQLRRAVVCMLGERPMIAVVVCCRCAAVQFRTDGPWRDGGSPAVNLGDGGEPFPEGAAMRVLGGPERTRARLGLVYADLARGQSEVSAWYAAQRSA